VRSGASRQRPAATPLLVIVAVFVVSRAAAYAAGMRFDDGLLHNAYQLLDVRLLRDDPLTSIYYLHSQPPLFNAFTALVVQLPDGAINTVLAITWHAAGLGTAIVIYLTMVRLGVRAPVATVMVCVYLLAPEVLLTESWFFYSQLQMLLTAITLYGLARYASTRRTLDGLLFTGGLGALVLLRSSIHVVVMVVLVVVVWRQLRIGARQLAAIAAVPLVVVAVWSIKNVLVFDSPSNSTWIGMNLSYLARAGTTDARCRQLEERGSVSASACHVAFERPTAFERQFPHPHTYGVAATDQLYKSTGQPNFNAALYIDVAQQYLRDSLTLLRHGGASAVTRAELAAYSVWAEPGDDALQLRKVRAPVAGYADWFDRLVLLRPVATGWNDPARFTARAGAFPWGDALGSISYTLLALFGLALYGGVAGWRRGARNNPTLRTVCTIALVLLVYSVTIGNALDFRENNRFRVEVAPVTLVLAAVGVELLLQRRSSRRERDETEVIPAPRTQQAGR
jgi:hypothetical protein